MAILSGCESLQVLIVCLYAYCRYTIIKREELVSH